MALRFRVHLDRTVLSSQLYLDFLKNVCCKDAIWSCLFDRPPNLCFFVDRGVTNCHGKFQSDQPDCNQGDDL